MHEFHKKIYSAMTLIAKMDVPEGIPTKLGIYLTTEGYVNVDDNEGVNITEKGLNLLGRLEEFKHKDLSRIATWVGLLVSGTLSLFATIISLIALFGRGT